MDYINWDEPSMKLALHGLPGILHRSLAFVLDDAILEVRRINKLVKEGNAQAQRIGSRASQARESPDHPWVDFVPEKTDAYKAAKIKLVEEKLVELLSFILDWDKEKLDDATKQTNTITWEQQAKKIGIAEFMGTPLTELSEHKQEVFWEYIRKKLKD